MRRPNHRLCLFFILGLGIVVIPSHGFAQPEDLVIDPSPPSTPAQPSPQASVPVTQNNQPSADENGEGAMQPQENRGQNYVGDYLDASGDRNHNNHGRFDDSSVPTVHRIESGDTLWGLSERYFESPWKWPKLWALNPEVKDPHWIYPGDTLRMKKVPGQQLILAAHETAASGEQRGASRTPRLLEVLYVDIADLDDAGHIVGAVDDKSMLSSGDSVYLKYSAAEVPTVGQRFAVYQPRKTIYRNGSSVGAYVEVAGELEILTVAKGKPARGILLRSVRPVERGMMVGPLKLNVAPTQPQTSKRPVSGRIAAVVGPDTLIGAQSKIIIDRGSRDGVDIGNRFFVVRRGDAYSAEMGDSSEIGKDDGAFPARAIGEVTVIQAGKAASLGLVTFSTREFGVGDRVHMPAER